MEEVLFIDNKKCVTTCVVHLNGKALMLHDPRTQRITGSITHVKKGDLMKILSGTINEEDKIMNKILENFDVDRDPITAAYAYTALKNASKQFDIQKLLLSENIKICENKCFLTNIFMEKNSKNYAIKCFSIELLPEKQTMDDLSITHVLVNRDKIIVKPSPGSNTMEVYFMGLKMTQMTGIITMLFWDLHFNNDT